MLKRSVCSLLLTCCLVFQIYVANVHGVSSKSQASDTASTSSKSYNSAETVEDIFNQNKPNKKVYFLVDGDLCGYDIPYTIQIIVGRPGVVKSFNKEFVNVPGDKDFLKVPAYEITSEYNSEICRNLDVNKIGYEILHFVPSPIHRPGSDKIRYFLKFKSQLRYVYFLVDDANLYVYKVPAGVIFLVQTDDDKEMLLREKTVKMYIEEHGQVFASIVTRDYLWKVEGDLVMGRTPYELKQYEKKGKGAWKQKQFKGEMRWESFVNGLQDSPWQYLNVISFYKMSIQNEITEFCSQVGARKCTTQTYLLVFGDDIEKITVYGYRLLIEHLLLVFPQAYSMRRGITLPIHRTVYAYVASNREINAIKNYLDSNYFPYGFKQFKLTIDSGCKTVNVADPNCWKVVAEQPTKHSEMLGFKKKWAARIPVAA